MTQLEIKQLLHLCCPSLTRDQLAFTRHQRAPISRLRKWHRIRATRHIDVPGVSGSIARSSSSTGT